MYSIGDNDEVLEFYLYDYDEFRGYSTGAWAYLSIYWQNNEVFIIWKLSLNPFTGASEEAEFNLYDIGNSPNVSPDLTLAYRHERVFNIASSTTIAELDADGSVSWRPDSSGFIVAIEDEGWRGLDYYDRDGNLLERLFKLDGSWSAFSLGPSGRSERYWSQNGERFAFVVNNPDLNATRLYIIDWQERVIIDTCLSPLSSSPWFPTSPAWSPDGTMVAYLALARENLKLVVFDTVTWEAYDVARHSGRWGYMTGNPDVIGWRPPDDG